MTLVRRLNAQLGLLLACLLLTAAGAVWGVRGLKQDFSQALGGYEQLRQLYQVGFHLQAARAALTADFPDLPLARLEVRRASQLFNQTLANDATAGETRTADVLSRAAVAAEDARPSVSILDRPLAVMNQQADALREAIAAAQRTADLRQRYTLIGLIGLSVVTVLASLIIGRRQVRAVMRPMGQITAGVQRVAAGEFDQPLDMNTADAEFARLADEFNAMARQLEVSRTSLEARVESATRAMVQSERLAGVGLLAAGVAHEINNPLSIIAAQVELLQTGRIDPGLRSALDDVLEETFRCKTLIERLLSLSRGPTGTRSLVALDEITKEVIAAASRLPAAAGRQWETKLDAVNVMADAGEIRQVVLNLLLNALQFTEAAGTISVQVQRQGNTALLTVADDGRGMDAMTMGRLFEPFYSTAAGERRGTGLGLAISKAIIEAHGGRIEAFSNGPGQGSRFVVTLPAAGGE